MHLWILARSLAGPLLNLFFLLLASGLFTTIISLRLDYEGFEKGSIGIVTAALYLGVFLGSLFLGRFIRWAGHLRSLASFSIVLALLILGKLLWMDVYYWAFLRLIGGVCTAGVFIVIESWLLLQTSPSMRGTALALYLITLYGGLSMGQFLVHVAEPYTATPFYISAVLCLLSLAPLFLQKATPPPPEKEKPLSLPTLFRASPLGFLGGMISGMVLAVIYALMPLYGKELGLSVSEIGTLMAMVIFGGLTFQWPMAYWGDRGHRKKALNSSCFLTAGLGICLASVEGSSYGLLLALAWLFGGFSFTIYPLSMAYLCAKVGQEQIVAATGGFVLSYSIGAVMGPLLAPLAIGLFGGGGLFYFLAALTLALGLCGLKRDRSAKEKTEGDS